MCGIAGIHVFNPEFAPKWTKMEEAVDTLAISGSYTSVSAFDIQEAPDTVVLDGVAVDVASLDLQEAPDSNPVTGAVGNSLKVYQWLFTPLTLADGG